MWPQIVTFRSNTILNQTFETVNTQKTSQETEYTDES